MDRRAHAHHLVASSLIILVGIGLLAVARSPLVAGERWQRVAPPPSPSLGGPAVLVAGAPEATGASIVMVADGTNEPAGAGALPDVTIAGPAERPTIPPTGEAAMVTRVIDGDTVELGTGQKVRYIGLDAPEATGDHLDCFGREATARNTALVLDKTVTLTRDVSEADRYGRLLRFVWLDGVLINDQLVREGYAHAATFPPDVARAGQFVAAEVEARAAGRGLWSGCPGGVTRSDYNPSVPQASGTDCPADQPIKGNAQSKIYHLPGQKYYATTRPEACFATEAAATAAGYRKAKI